MALALGFCFFKFLSNGFNPDETHILPTPSIEIHNAFQESSFVHSGNAVGYPLAFYSFSPTS
jgi:hypothetical protein